ncbi:amidohydrolase family protein [Geodermatophilus sp. SYSU D00815]
MTGDEAFAPVDAHVHVWDLAVNSYPWLGPERGGLYASFPPEQAREALAGCGFGAAVLVQAEDSTAETRYLLAVADAHPWVAGVVGWLPLADPAAAAASLEELFRHPRFRGVRHLVHADPRADFLDTAPVRESLRLVAAAGLPLDVPDAYPRHLTQTARLAEDLPELVVVVDHLAKPPLGRPEMGEWRAQLARAAAAPNTVAKVSGLRAPGTPYTVAAVRPAWEAALELFGPARLMYGSDWPVTVPEDAYGPEGYRPTHEVLAALVGELSADEQRALTGATARRVYRLP